MADSIKFIDHYIDTTGTWDSSSSKTQAVINTEKLNIADLQNNLVTTVSGYALDARAGKTLDDSIIKKDGSSNMLNTFGTDLNDFKSGIVFAHNCTNSPASGVNNDFFVIASGDINSIKQIAFRFVAPSAGEIWERHFISSSNPQWSTWQQGRLCNLTLDSSTNTLNITSL